MSNNNMNKLKKFGKGLVTGYKSSKRFVEREGPKVHRYLAKTADATGRAFEVKPLGNKVALAGTSRNTVALTKNPRLKKVRGNLYWDFR